jgi:hypothetical protein
MFPAKVAEVVVIGPTADAGPLGAAIRDAVNAWNLASAQRHRMVLLRGAAQRAEDLDPCDVVVGVFDPKQTGVDILGEVLRARRAGKVVLVWLIAKSPPGGACSGEDGALVNLAHQLRALGVSPRYLGEGDRDVESRMRSALNDDLSSSILRALTAGADWTMPERQVTTCRTPVPQLGPYIWGVTVVNDGTSLAVGLTVSVQAVDAEGDLVTGGAVRSRQSTVDVFSKLRVARWPQEHGPMLDVDPAALARRRSFLTTPMNVLAAHTALDFPSWLRPRQHASALYELRPDASPRVHIQFEDEAGCMWSRTNDDEPQQLSPSPTSRNQLVRSTVTS